MPKKTRVKIYEQLFKEGVMVAEKNLALPKHPQVLVPNLHVIKAVQVSHHSVGFSRVKLMKSGQLIGRCFTIDRA